MSLAALVPVPVRASGPAVPSLGSAASFAIVSGSAVLNHGPTRVMGNVGSNSLAGLTAQNLTVGDFRGTDTLARAARHDFLALADDLARLPDSVPVNPCLPPPVPAEPCRPGGVYSLTSPLTGTLILDGQGNPDSVWVFRTTGAFVTASDSTVAVTNGGLKDHVFWLAESATLGERSVLLGNLLVHSGITMEADASLYGRAFARDGPVTLDSDLLAFCCDAITLSSVPPIAPNVPYDETIQAGGGTAPYKFELFDGTLPPELTLMANGELKGTRTSSGAFRFTVIATDAHGCLGIHTYAVCPTITLDPLNPPTCAVYDQMIGATATGGASSYTFHSNDKPDGLTLTGGHLTGKPDATPSCASFTITAVDANGCSGSRLYTACRLSPVIVLTATAGVPFSTTISPDGTLCGPLPPGLSGFPTISGTPMATGSYPFSVTTAVANGFVTRDYTIDVVCPDIKIPEFPDATACEPYLYKIVPTGAGAPYTFQPLAPPPLTLAADGTLFGTPPTTGVFSLLITATDRFDCSTTVVRTLTVSCPTITLSPGTLPNATVGGSYSQQIVASPPPGPYTFTLTSVPPGPFVITTPNPPDVTGVITATSLVAGDFTLTVTATACSCKVSAVYHVKVVPPGLPACTQTLVLATSPLPGGVVGIVYSQPVVSGGTPPYTYLPLSGTPPPGMALLPSGSLGGTPTATGRFCFSITATDANGCYAGPADYSIVIDPPSCPAATPITISPPGLPPAILNTPYFQVISAVGGTPPYTFTVTSGTLPPGLTLNPATGVLSGTPTVQCDFPLIITATDANGCFNTMACSMVLSVVIPATSGTTLLLLSMALAVVGCVAMRRVS